MCRTKEETRTVKPCLQMQAVDLSMKGEMAAADPGLNCARAGDQARGGRAEAEGCSQVAPAAGQHHPR